MAKRVFVIEDDKDIRETIVYVLEEEGYEVFSSASSKLLQSLDELKPDIILLDNWLTDWKSDANGQQISKQLKSDPKTSHIPVIIISAVSNVKEIAEAGQADSYLMKPFGVNDLTEIVKRFI